MTHASYPLTPRPQARGTAARHTVLTAQLDQFDRAIVAWLTRWSIPLARVALGLVFVWFGGLKFFAGLSPAQDLAGRTIEALSLGLMAPSMSRPLLATWEVAIGLGFLTGRWPRLTLLLLLSQMAGTLLPLVFYPDEVFQHVPYAPTLEGQYIVKNLVLVAAGLIIGSTARGGAPQRRGSRRRHPAGWDTAVGKRVFRQHRRACRRSSTERLHDGTRRTHWSCRADRTPRLLPGR